MPPVPPRASSDPGRRPRLDPVRGLLRPDDPDDMDGTALILCEGGFGTPEGKTAHGLVRHTTRYRVVGVIDSRHAGKEAADVIEGARPGIPVFGSLDRALETMRPDYLVIGLAPDGGQLPAPYRASIAQALKRGIHVDSGLHTFLGDDPELESLARGRGARIRDIRKPPPRSELHFFRGVIEDVKAVKIAVLGTDSAIGKRTTAVKLVQMIEATGLKAELIGTGQTSWMQGVEYGIVLDSLVNDFVSGEIENAIYRAWVEKDPRVIVIEGQGGLTNPAYPGGFEILAAGRPDGIVLQHAPKRRTYDGFPSFPMRPLAEEVRLIELLARKPVIALTINHEDMTDEEIDRTAQAWQAEFAVPAVDPLRHGVGEIVDELFRRFPPLTAK